MKATNFLSKTLLAAVACVAGLSASADQTWKGTVDNLWTTASNWSGGAIPGSSDLVIYNSTSTANTSNWLSQAFGIKGIVYSNVPSPFSINSASTLTIGSSGINMTNATQPLTIVGPIALSGNQSWIVATNQSLSVSGGISGSSTIYKDTGGTLYLNGPNTFTGAFTNNGGPVWINDSGSLGAGTKVITIANNAFGAGLHLNGTNTPIVLPSTISYVASEQFGTIINEAGNNTINGPISVFSGGGLAYMVVNAGTLTLNGNITLGTSSRPIALGGAGNGTLGGAIVGANFPFRKLDAGMWTFTNNNTYSGYTTVEGGTLALGATAKLSGTTNITVYSNATFDVSAVTNASGQHIFTLASSVQVLAGEGTINGNFSAPTAVSIQPGSSNIAQTFGGMGVTGTLTFNNNLTLGATVTNMFELNTATTVGSGVNDLINVGGDLDPQNARIFVTGLAAFTVGTPYQLFNYSGNKLSSFNPTVLSDTHYSFTVDETVTNQINVTVSGAVPNLIWHGSATASNWDLNTSANWNNNTSTFLNLDPAVFDDTGVNSNVTLVGTLRPASVVYSNSSVNYVLQGSGKITGLTGVTKYGSGMLAISNTASDYTGPMVINAGTVAIWSVNTNGVASTLGAGSNVTLNGGTLQFGGARPVASGFNRFFTLGANGGTIVSTNATFFIPNTISGPGSLTKAGSAQVILGDIVPGALSNASNSYSGNTYATQGDLQLRNAKAIGFGKAVVSAGADLSFGGNGNYGMFTNEIDLNGGDGNGSAGTLQLNDAGTTVNFTGPIYLLANSSVGTVNNGNAVSFTISGPINGVGALKKLGTNSVILSGLSNSYSGGTLVTSGILDVQNDGALGTGNVTVVSNATLKLEQGATHGYLASTANLLLSNTPTVNLAFTGAPAPVNALSFDGGQTFKAAGTWGSSTSGAAHTDSRFTGNGTLNVLTGPATTTTVTPSQNSVVYGTAVVFTVNVTPASATGTVTLLDGSTTLGTATLVSGQATFTNVLAAATSPHSITASYSGDNNDNLSVSTSVSEQVTPATLTITGLSAQSKVYDSTSTATIIGTPGLGGVLFNDPVTLAGAAVGSFPSKTVVTNGAVTVTGLALTGAAAGNYTLAPLVLSASITPYGLTANGITASDRIYDGTTSATINTSAATLAGVLGSDNVTLSTTGATGAFVDPNVGLDKSVVISGLTLAGSDAGNYTVSASVTASIRYSVTVSGISASDKVYDGTTNALLNVSNVVLVGVQGTDDVSLDTTNAVGGFTDRNAGTNKTVDVSGLALLGAQADLYSLTQPTTNASISAMLLTVTAAADTKTYDGTTNSGGMPAITDGDIATNDIAPVWTQSFDSRNAGARTLTATGGNVNDGNGGSNYVVTFATASGTILPLPLTVTAVTDSKVYNGTTASAGVPTITSGAIVSGDTAPIWTQTFDSANGGARSLIPAGVVSDGNGGNNYAITFVSASGTIIAASSQTLLVSSLNPSGPGTNVTFTATVSSSAGMPTGSMIFLANGTPFGTNLLTAGLAAVSNSSLALGTNVVEALYGGDGNFAQSTNCLQQVVKQFVTYSQTNSILGITRNADGTVTLVMQGTPQAQYYVVATIDLTTTTSNWLALAGSTNTVTNSNGQWTYIATNSASQQFYRSAAVNPQP